MSNKSKTDQTTKGEIVEIATLNPEQIAAKLFGDPTDYVLSAGSTYDTEIDGIKLKGQRIARARLPFLIDGKPCGLTMPINVSKLTTADGQVALSVSFAMFGSSQAGKGGISVLADSKPVSDAIRDRARDAAQTWYARLSTADRTPEASAPSKPRLVFMPKPAAPTA
jgi:hypothetical protein